LRQAAACRSGGPARSSGVGRSAVRYRSRKEAKDAPVLARMRQLAAQCPRYRYRRISIFLGRDGHPMSFGRAKCGRSRSRAALM